MRPETNFNCCQRYFQESSSAETRNTIQQVDHPNNLPATFLQCKERPSISSTKLSDTSSKIFSNNSYDLSLSTPQSNDKHPSMSQSLTTRIAEPSNLALPKHENKDGTLTNADIGASRDKMIDSASLVIDKLACGKPLPQKETRPLLHTLLVADPLPLQQLHFPLSSSSGLPLSGIRDNNYNTNMDDVENGFIPTSLSLAFQGNSCGPSQSFGLSVKNESVSYVNMDSNMMHNHALVGKKRKLL
ncbi:hypothetical protein RJT34_18971 [Clitoria ternatea]|uniref:Uncharacterized protein n=1 Tax=Clitoria ternatea TaxID=43366 RepID=A0AAN9IQL2_CLITE